MKPDPIAEMIVGITPAIAKVRSLITKLAPSPLPVLIQGPTGSGKELVARALHVMSGRPGKFVAFNVCAIAETMFEDALFGHVKGAFTGAQSDSPGYFAQADRGTVLLDEIGDLSLDRQAKLLRVLDAGQFRPVGAKSEAYSDFRLIAATNQDLDALVKAATFRLDLAHRLSAATIIVPSLAERREDIAMLARHFARQVRLRCGSQLILTAGAQDVLGAHDWPGNVRELRNTIGRLAALAEVPEVTEEMMSAVVRGRRADQPVEREVDGRRAQLIELLRRYEWDTEKVASVLDVHRGTIYRRMQALGITAPRRVGFRPKRPNGGEPLDSHHSHYSH